MSYDNCALQKSSIVNGKKYRIYNNIAVKKKQEYKITFQQKKLNLILEASTSIYLVGKWKFSFYLGDEI